MAIRDAVHSLGIEIRAGLHTGECQVRGDDIGGIGARVSALAGPNDVLVSSTLRDLVIGSGLQFEERSAHQLKGVPGEWCSSSSLRRKYGTKKSCAGSNSHQLTDKGACSTGASCFRRSRSGPATIVKHAGYGLTCRAEGFAAYALEIERRKS
jgi:hypothetical protein